MKYSTAEKWSKICTFISCIGPLFFILILAAFFYIWYGAAFATQKALHTPVVIKPTDPNQTSTSSSTDEAKSIGKKIEKFMKIANIFMLFISPPALIAAILITFIHDLEFSKLLSISATLNCFLLFYFGKQLIYSFAH